MVHARSEHRRAAGDDAPALALRVIAMAQLGDLVRAKALLRSAARAFGPKAAVARATSATLRSIARFIERTTVAERHCVRSGRPWRLRGQRPSRPRRRWRAGRGVNL